MQLTVISIASRLYQTNFPFALVFGEIVISNLIEGFSLYICSGSDCLKSDTRVELLIYCLSVSKM